MRFPYWACLLVGVALLTGVPDVLAAEGAEHGPSNPLAIDYWSVGYTVVVFVLLLVILGRFAFRPILGALNAREEFIAQSLQDAEAASVKAQAILAEYSQKLDAARAEASALVEEGRRDAEVVKRQIQDEARGEADAMIARAKREIGIARDSAVRELYDLGGKLATDVASKILARELNASDHQRLIEESIAELRKADVSKN